MKRDGSSPDLLWLHVWGPRLEEHPGTQVAQPHKNCPASAHFCALAYVSRNQGKVAVFHQSTLYFHCVFDELCPGFCLKASNQKTGCGAPRRNCGYWASTGQLLLDSLRSVRPEHEETASTLKNPEKLQLLTHILTSTLWNQLFSFKNKPAPELFQVQCMIVFAYATLFSVGFGLFRKYLELFALTQGWTWVSLQPVKCIGTKDIGLSWQVSSMKSIICGALWKAEMFWETVGKGCLGGSKLGWELSSLAFHLENAVPSNSLCSAY